ncbi:hypothetical protein [Tumebacillus flagellatus]|uniref:Uncharacterized protein n=1 Tax=Tumebacillus flagellatus TaxID=1157490 RepID=A0A074LWE0_9BACL|nr:hypothetical protein [Tumebacillus flagellatus]KEO84393.1 hypothetical protein EL26_04630 [Tumebacillus flagellatus]
MNYAYILEQSRKAKATRSLYEYLKTHTKQPFLPGTVVADFPIADGIQVQNQDKHRVINLRLHDEHLSPYMRSDMSLFHLLMMDEKADIRMYRAENGWMLVFEGIQVAPKPFGQSGYDMR